MRALVNRGRGRGGGDAIVRASPTPSRSILTLLALLAPLVVAAAQEPADDAEAFERSFAAARELTQGGRWSRARESWIALLRDHAGADYVRPRLPDVRQSLRRSVFWADRRRPEPKDLTSGFLRRWDRVRGKMRIDYGPRTLGDFEDLGDDVRMHPARFRGPYTLELVGDPKMLGSLMLFCGMDGDEGYLVNLGRRIEGELFYEMHQLFRVGQGDLEELDEATPRELPDLEGRATVKVVVNREQVRVSYDGRRIMTARRDDEPYGGFGFAGAAPFERLTLSGPVETSWIEGLIDAAVQEEWQSFDDTYREPPELEAWRQAPAARKSTRDLGELASQIDLGADLTPQETVETERTLAWIAAGEPRQAVEHLEGAGAGLLPDATREVLLTLAWLREHHHRNALVHLDRALAEGAGSFELRRLRVMLLVRCEEVAPSIEALRELLEEHTEDVALHADLAQLLLLEGRWSDARAALEVGLRVAPGDGDLTALRRQIVQAEQGPPWKRSHGAEGQRFVVSSSLNARICRVAARELDGALERYEERLGELPEGGPPTRVFLFAGEAGYQAYIEGVDDGGAEQTHGIYSPRLAQILTWNLASRELQLRTLRHEAMHRYLHLRLGDAPRWLDEGLAEYFAASKTDRDTWQEGGVDADWLAVFRAWNGQTIPLDTFLFLDDAAFVVEAELAYAQSWALVHFLLNGGPAERALFDALWAELEGRTDPQSAVAEVLQGVDLDELDFEFRAHLGSLLAH